MKLKLIDDLFFTTNSESCDSSCILKEFIMKITEYRPDLNFISKCEFDSYECPILYLFKAILHLGEHSFHINPKVKEYYDKCIKTKYIFEEKFGERMEEWELNWINIFDCILKNDNVTILEYFLIV